jgi:copper homeostasis protein
MIIEVCVNSAISAIEAMKGGADRVELCENLHDGGTTPSTGSIRLARKRLETGLFVMIRPRGGDFLYSDDEFEIMQEDILSARKIGADGVVFGILKADGTIDQKRMAVLCDLARPMGITCHRAFDMTEDPSVALEDLISLGIDRVLTSGQRSTANEGIPLIRQLMIQSAGRIAIMPGSGVKEHNIVEIIRETGVNEIHIHPDRKEPSKMIYHQDKVYMGTPDASEYEHPITDRVRVANLVFLADPLRSPSHG